MGVFTVYNDQLSDSTTISNLFIDEYMKEANDAQLKIYLFLLRMMSAGESTSISDMADRFNHTEKEVIRSLKYWEKNGLLSLEYDENGSLGGIHLCELKTRSAHSDNRIISITPMLSSRQEASSSSRRVKASAENTESSAKTTKRIPDVSAIAAFKNDKKRAELLFVLEQYIGKPLSVNEIKVIYYISEELKFKDELIDYLVAYCVDRGKKDFRYIEKVAINWAEKGITTPKQAEKASLEGSKASSKSSTKKSNTTNKFNQFEQNTYDFDALEKELLNN